MATKEKEKIMTHKEKAAKLFKNGYHCAQALIGVYADEFGFNPLNTMKLSTCFGSGMRHGGLCGCISSALMICGMAYGGENPLDNELELHGNKMAEKFIERFKEKTEGKILCSDILGADVLTPEGMAKVHTDGLTKKVCPKILDYCVEILDELIEENKDNLCFAMSQNENQNDTDDFKTVSRHADGLIKFRKDINEILISSDKNIAFIQFDIKRFKIINDLYGESFGDEVLYFVNEKLKSVCSDNQLYLNVRSDVFMVVTEYTEQSDVLDFVGKIEKAMDSYKNVKLQYVFGVYYVEDRSMEIRQMEDRAAMARKSAKANVVTNVTVYQQRFKDILYTRKFIEENMQSAIEENQFKMYIQPKYNIYTNKIIGAEALVRWFNPERGKIYPNEFIPVMEENGFITELDYFMWKEACELLSKCAKNGIKDCPISVNVSRHHLKDTRFIEELRKYIDENNVEKPLIQLEITETVNDQLISQMAEKLKDEGFTLLMDDFGSGYSSLNVLLETPFDVIKLDKKFMDNMMNSDKGKTILEHVISMAEDMGLGIVAEGVETKEQVELLKKIGCGDVQGFYYSKPMPEEEFFDILKSDRGVEATEKPVDNETPKNISKKMKKVLAF
jgi:C_GCAxxG_C_C family probable redox protein